MSVMVRTFKLFWLSFQLQVRLFCLIATQLQSLKPGPGYIMLAKVCPSPNET